MSPTYEPAPAVWPYRTPCALNIQRLPASGPGNGYSQLLAPTSIARPGTPASPPQSPQSSARSSRRPRRPDRQASDATPSAFLPKSLESATTSEPSKNSRPRTEHDDDFTTSSTRPRRPQPARPHACLTGPLTNEPLCSALVCGNSRVLPGSGRETNVHGEEGWPLLGGCAMPTCSSRSCGRDTMEL